VVNESAFGRPLTGIVEVTALFVQGAGQGKQSIRQSSSK
jgi:hypothetical protein